MAKKAKAPNAKSTGIKLPVTTGFKSKQPLMGMTAKFDAPTGKPKKRK